MMCLGMQEDSTEERQWLKGAAASVMRPGAAPRPEVTARAAVSRHDRGTAMLGGEIDQINRRIKKAADGLAADNSLTSEGKGDQGWGR